MQLHQQENELARLQTRVLLIGFEPRRRARGWLEQAEITFPFLLDPDQTVYDAYRLDRSFWQAFHPRNLWSYVKAAFRGQFPSAPAGDPYQMGGDFIVDQKGIIRFAYYPADASDRPAVAELLQRLHELAQPGSHGR